MQFLRKIIFLAFILPIGIFALNYDVKFTGLKERNTLASIKRVSNLVILQERPPKTINALRFRANSDTDEILKVLHFYGFYDAKIDIDLEENKNIVLVNVLIMPGVRYTIKDVKIYTDCTDKKEMDIAGISIKDLDLKINSALITQNILNAEKKLIFLLSNKGYPLAKVEKREVIIDQTHKNAFIEWCVDIGSFSLFGDTKINGLKSIDKSFIDKKIKWQQGQKYDSRKVIETQQNLLKTNLFSSVAILHEDKIDEKDELEMNLKLVESLHKYISTGVSYATIDGFGVSLSWANRNFRSQGELLAIDANVAQRLILGVATYKKPDFMRIDQNYIIRSEASREKIPASYLAFIYSMENRIDRKFSKRINGSFGFRAEYNEITHSANNGNFFLLSLPAFLKFSSANNLLNPTHGQTIIYRAQPFKNTINSSKYFFKQTLIYNLYIPLEKNRNFILAIRMTLGSIFGANVFDLPLTKLFLGGSDDDLRGYKYRTVSPLDGNNDPIGGRSAIYFSFEPRIRLTEKIGLVPFTDLGVVSFKEVPSVNEKWFKSVGIGFRYFSFFGPIRLDVAFPLDRRRAIDPSFKIYVSVGQTF
ncbi:MAG: Translocation and assembly module TamA [Candidatus Anoxychlamydiales bacterium]|nr:Translocation and assembly module TamA [Candidatus Anoxychlamydiales bacterium]NGX41283.1 Translocation and assembly module TamA [Candidatus Anoxychlamydiales bacterium]HEU64964.1 hypothetical protein [Chlamydiota bacterium]